MKFGLPKEGIHVGAEAYDALLVEEFFWRRRADSNRRIELLQSSALTTWLRRHADYIITFMVPRRRLELLRANAHGPLKTACLPIPPPRQ